MESPDATRQCAACVNDRLEISLDFCLFLFQKEISPN
jgi:hypothetical protein